MIEYDLDVNSESRIYWPKVFVRSFGNRLKATPNSRCMLVYPRAASVQQILVSLRHLAEHFEILARED
jgi:hypothetical protein